MLAVIKSKVVPGGDLAKVMRACCMISNSTATSTAVFCSGEFALLEPKKDGDLNVYIFCVKFTSSLDPQQIMKFWGGKHCSHAF